VWCVSIKEENQMSLKTRTNIYAEKEVIKTFKEICKREGTNMSSKTEDFWKQYNQAHKPGNPQLKMSNYVANNEPQPMRVLCVFIDGAVTDGRVHCRRAGQWIPGVQCYSCEKNQLRKRK
jgi:hypothetical protein